MIYSKEKIERLYQAGNNLKYLFFWGHQPNPSGKISSSCLSQWWNSEFNVDGTNYATSEHWMMAEKARLFNDQETLKKILVSESPRDAKKLGREIKNFDQYIWEKYRVKIVVKGNYFKFIQNKELETYLLNTKNRILVEASPVDRIWGIGLDSTSDFATIPTKWRGLNLLGFALMEVRDRIVKNQQLE